MNAYSCDWCCGRVKYEQAQAYCVAGNRDDGNWLCVGDDVLWAVSVAVASVGFVIGLTGDDGHGCLWR